MNNKHGGNANIEERLIIEKALENLEKYLGTVTRWQFATMGAEVDGELEFTYNGIHYQIPVEIKKEIRAQQLAKILKQKHHLKKLMVVAEYIYPKLKEELRAEGIAYLETSGNIFMKEENLFLLIDHFKSEPEKSGASGRAFAKTGLRLLFHFLVNEDIVNLTYREIAQRTGVGFGNINFIITDLKEQGFLLNINQDKYKLIRKDQLLEKWTQAYNEKLKPSLEIGTFRFINKNQYFNWNEIALKSGETFWSGEPAGGILTNHLQPQQYTLYTTETRMDLVKCYQLIPDKNGDVKIYLKFWQLPEEQVKTAPPLLVYADLINSNDRRCIETAEKVYDEYLQTQFRAN